MPFTPITITPIVYVPGIGLVNQATGALVNIGESRANGGPGSSYINPQALQSLAGAMGSFDAQGGGVVGGQSPPPASADTGTAGSGANINISCMTADQLNQVANQIGSAVGKAAEQLGLDTSDGKSDSPCTSDGSLASYTDISPSSMASLTDLPAPPSTPPPGSPDPSNWAGGNDAGPVSG